MIDNSFEGYSEHDLLLLTIQTVRRIEKHLEKQNGNLCHLESRVDSLEDTRSTAIGMITALTFILGSGSVLALIAWISGII